MCETLKEVVEQEDESQIVAQDAHDDYYDSRSIIPADNVDANGVPWTTVGENIRKGAKESPSKEKVLEALSSLFGVKISYEEVNCTLTPNQAIIVDNNKFIGTNYAIRPLSSVVVAFFFLSSKTTTGTSNVVCQLAKGNNNINIVMQNTRDNAVTGTLKLGVLLA